MFSKGAPSVRERACDVTSWWHMHTTKRSSSSVNAFPGAPSVLQRGLTRPLVSAKGAGDDSKGAASVRGRGSYQLVAHAHDEAILLLRERLALGVAVDELEVLPRVRVLLHLSGWGPSAGEAVSVALYTRTCVSRFTRGCALQTAASHTRVACVGARVNLNLKG